MCEDPLRNDPLDGETWEIATKIRNGKLQLPKNVKTLIVLTENSTKLFLSLSGMYNIDTPMPPFFHKWPRMENEFWAQIGMVPPDTLEAYHHVFKSATRLGCDYPPNDYDLINFFETYYETVWGYSVLYNNKSKVLTLDVPAELRLKIVNRKKGLRKMMEFLFAKCVYTDRKKCIKTLLELSVKNLDPWMMEYLIINEEITQDLLVNERDFLVTLYELLDEIVKEFVDQNSCKSKKIKVDNLAENASHILWILLSYPLCVRMNELKEKR